VLAAGSDEGRGPQDERQDERLDERQGTGTGSDLFRDVLALSPMAMGGNLPYRRLCRSFGAQLTCSEMILAHKLVAGGEKPLLRHHPEEDAFGVQLAGKHAEAMAEAARMAADAGARFIDLNFGCPIDLIVKRGSGAALLQRPAKLAEIVKAVRAAVPLPLSVKLRLGYSEDRLNVVDLARRCQEAGADALGIHGRTRAQRYRHSARWELIDEAAAAVAIPVLGNGDILTPWDLVRRREQTCVRSFLVARGALVKPWIFRELLTGEPWYPTPAERWAIMRRFVDLACEHFGDDAKGLGRVERFFLWHCGFWHRYHPWTHADFLALGDESLLQARTPQAEGEQDTLLLASAGQDDHHRLWRRVLDRDYPGA
jgi:tRNA-dihydrouridine synthase 3